MKPAGVVVFLCLLTLASSPSIEASIRQSTAAKLPSPHQDRVWTVSDVRQSAWLTLALLRQGASSGSVQPTHTRDQGTTLDRSPSVTTAQYLVRTLDATLLDALAVCLEQPSILSHGKGLRVGRLDASAPADQVPSTKACPVEQLKALMHKLDLLDDKDALKPDAYLKALEAVGTFPAGQPPVYTRAGHVCSSDVRADKTCMKQSGHTWLTDQECSILCSVRIGACPVCCRCEGELAPGMFSVARRRLHTQHVPHSLKLWHPHSSSGQHTSWLSRLMDSIRSMLHPSVDSGPAGQGPVADADSPDAAPTANVLPAHKDPFPPSPYAPPYACTTKGSVDVAGYPSTPFPLSLFTTQFRDPPKGQVFTSSCHENGHCMDAYQINIQEIEVDLGVGCPAGIKTKMLSYNGSIPGPTIDVPVGRQSLMRFNNQINPGSTRYPAVAPCDGVTRPKGRPVSIHVHGMASLAPYDGFALDQICTGESKDYMYPNNRPGTLWYHDHALDITSENAYGGLAGLYFVREQPERWGLEGMQEHILVLSDKVMDENCQMLFDLEGPHYEFFFGDINFVNGAPWPVMHVQPKWIRLRLLNGAVSRSWLLSLRDDEGNVYSSSMCHVVASDGGFRRRPVTFPRAGLYMGSGERYEVVCDFSQVTGKTLYLWNQQDTARMTDSPFFCYSHLVMKIVVAPDCPEDCQAAPKFQPPSASKPTSFDRLFSLEEYHSAYKFAQSGGCHRSFNFRWLNGSWVINNQSWHDHRVAASDVGSNAWEVWCLDGQDGEHPVHFHLIDFYILKRYPQGLYQKLELYESEVPKDVVMLHPGAKVAGLARWGPHRGEYLFHCHNLRHEDTAMMRTFITNNHIKNTTGQSQRTKALSKFTFSKSMGYIYDQYKDPLLPDAIARATPHMPLLCPEYLHDQLGLELYRIFYPGLQDDRAVLCDPAVNPWLVKPC